MFSVRCAVFSVYMFGIEASRTAAAAVTFTNQHLWKVNTKLAKNSLTTVKLSPSTCTYCVTLTYMYVVFSYRAPCYFVHVTVNVNVADAATVAVGSTRGDVMLIGQTRCHDSNDMQWTVVASCKVSYLPRLHAVAAAGVLQRQFAIVFTYMYP